METAVKFPFSKILFNLESDCLDSRQKVYRVLFAITSKNNVLSVAPFANYFLKVTFMAVVITAIILTWLHYFIAAQKKKNFSIKVFFIKCDQIRRKLDLVTFKEKNPQYKTSFLVQCM